MRAIWKGSISFGLVNIPIALYPATRREELKFRLLREKDLSPVNYKRVAEKDGKEVPWDQIVKGYEYEKGKFIVLKDEDFQRVDLEATQTVDIQDFVEVEEIDPMYFYKPYYLEPQKGGDKAYTLLRDVLADTNKVGIAKVVIKTRQYLAGVKAKDQVLVLELMHFAEELADAGKLHVPKKLEAGKREMDMAKALVESMSAKWDPEKISRRLSRSAHGRDRRKGRVRRKRDRRETETKEDAEQGDRSGRGLAGKSGENKRREEKINDASIETSPQKGGVNSHSVMSSGVETSLTVGQSRRKCREIPRLRSERQR